MTLPIVPGEAISMGHFGPILVTRSGYKYILLDTDRFNRQAAMYPIAAAQFTAVGNANILVNDFIPKWGCPKSLLSDNGRQFFCELLRAGWELMGMRKLPIRTHHPMGNGGMERVNHTMAQFLSMVVNESPPDCDE